MNQSYMYIWRGHIGNKRMRTRGQHKPTIPLFPTLMVYTSPNPIVPFFANYRHQFSWFVVLLPPLAFQKVSYFMPRWHTYFISTFKLLKSCLKQVLSLMKKLVLIIFFINSHHHLFHVRLVTDSPTNLQ